MTAACDNLAVDVGGSEWLTATMEDEASMCIPLIGNYGGIVKEWYCRGGVV